MRKRTPGLLVLGTTAVIAGCGGGGAQSPGSVGHFVPPPAPIYAMSSATLTVQIPARGKASARRKPTWISPSSSTLGVRVLPQPLPNPTPTEQAFTLPTPGPAPTSTTLTVAAPVASDTFVVTAYDGSGNALSTGSSALTTIAANTTNNVNVTLAGVARGVLFTVNGSSTPAAWRVLTDLGADQTAAINAAPVDAQGNLIPGTLASPAPVNGTGGAQLSASSITAATTLTATYPHGTNTQATLTSPLAMNANPSPLNVSVNADSYVYVVNSDTTVQVIDALTRSQVGSTITGMSSSQVGALSGCSTGAFAVEGRGSTADEISIAAPTVANPTPLPSVAPFAPTALSSSPIWNGITADNACNLYYNVGDGSVYPLVQFSGFDSSLTPNTAFGSGFNGTGALVFLGAQINLIAGNTSSVNTLFVPASSGGAAMSSASYSYSPASLLNSILIGSGSSLYLITNTCSTQPMLQALSGGPAITLSEFATAPGSPVVTGAAEASDGTMYVAGFSPSSTPILAYAAVSNIGSAPSVPLGGTPLGVAITPDQQFVCVLESPSGSNGQIEFFQRNPSPSLVGTVALSSTAQPSAFSIGP